MLRALASNVCSATATAAARGGGDDALSSGGALKEVRGLRSLLCKPRVHHLDSYLYILYTTTARFTFPPPPELDDRSLLAAPPPPRSGRPISRSLWRFDSATRAGHLAVGAPVLRGDEQRVRLELRAEGGGDVGGEPVTRSSSGDAAGAQSRGGATASGSAADARRRRRHQPLGAGGVAGGPRCGRGGNARALSATSARTLRGL